MTTIPNRPELLLEQRGWLRALARHLVADADGADDLVQDTLVAALDAGRPAQAPMRAWLTGIARRLSASARRRDARRQVHEAAVARVVGEQQLESAAVDVAERFAMHRAVVEAVAALEEPYRDTVLLRFWEGLPPREIAARRGLPVETVRTQLKRSLAKLRTRLDRSHGGRSAWALPLMRWVRDPAVHTAAAPATVASGWSLTVAAAAVVVGVVPLCVVGGDGAPDVAATPGMLAGTVARAGNTAADGAAARLERRPVMAHALGSLPPQEPQRVQDPREPQLTHEVVTSEWLFWVPDDAPQGGAGGKFGGRTNGRERLARNAPEDAAAIAAGLGWLVRHQAQDGSFPAERFWMSNALGGAADGAGESGRDVGATAIALLALLGDGQTCRSGEHQDAIRRGVLWLCQQQRAASGAFCDPESAPRYVFDHALATWALAEAYGLSGMLHLRPFAERALDHLDALRVPSGGWCAPMADATSDVAVVTVFAQFAQVVARDFKLRERADAGDAHAMAWAAGRIATPDGVRIAPFPPSLSLLATAESELVLARFLTPDVPSEDLATSVSRQLFAANAAPGRMAMHLAILGTYQCGGVTWRKVKPTLVRLRDEQRTDGRFAGSWDPDDPWTRRTGGRVFATALATMTLESHYRFTMLVH